MTDYFSIKEDLTQINVYKMPAETCFLSLLFGRLFVEKIEIDMISRPLTHTFDTQLSFTIKDTDLKRAVKILAQLKKEFPELKFSICAGNSKITLNTDNSQKTSLFSIIFEKFCDLNIEILLISSGKKDLSLLISNSNAITARYILDSLNFK